MFAATIGRCFSFWYHMYGSSIGTLNIYTRTSDGATKLLWNLKSNQGNVWKQAEVTLTSKKPFRILIEGIRGSSYTGDIALDDMYVQDGNCVGTCSSVLPTVRVNCGYFGISAVECITKRGLYAYYYLGNS